LQKNAVIVKDKIIDKIRSADAVSFHDFMEMALYYPEAGYYTSPGEKTGSKGDYFTSPYLGNIFGAMVAKQLEEMWMQLNEASFTIVEYGAGNGALCYDILTYMRQNAKMYNGITYYIIEKSPFMIEKEKVSLRAFDGKIKWIRSIKEIGEVTGCILSNEVVDNFSVHQVVMKDELMEVFVEYDGNFTEILRPAGEELKDYLQRFNLALPRNYRTEINLEAEDWIREIAVALKKGFVLTIDYGYSAADLYDQKKAAGTLLCYHNHRINDNPFLNVGEQDITTHVNFSALLHAGAREGLQYAGFTNQSYFLISLGLAEYIRKMEQNGYNNANGNPSLALLLNMGQKIKVFVQQKECKQVFLSGMRFSLLLE